MRNSCSFHFSALFPCEAVVQLWMTEAGTTSDSASDLASAQNGSKLQVIGPVLQDSQSQLANMPAYTLAAIVP